MKAGDDIKRPHVLAMAPTANAAYIIGGKTIDSAHAFSPMETDRYVQTDPARMASLKYLYDEVDVMFIDEISMVGSKKLIKINF